MSLLQDIAEFLKNQTIVDGEGIDTFIDTIPENPDFMISLNEYQGLPTPLHDPIVHKSVKIVVRSILPQDAISKINAIFNALSPADRYLELSETRWGQFYPRQTPFKERVDSSNRVYYTFNVGITTARD